ncbi:MAG: selenocysteine-specific translation elongation factor [Verrucomicrobia bacterium]|nr:selenocysteine-specific translation elongation factor [Verrucomicrobiota bacterium]
MTATRNFILGTAGHVDHGKSALVKALTGTDPDRLPEEKERGITIDLGFANLALGDFNIGIVDVPGHEDFVRNAASGIAFMNAVLFVVAANEGWMPQSEEHLQILDYLDVRRGIFVVTKCDLPAVAFDPPRADWPVVRVSAHTGEGLEQLRQTIIATLAGAPPSDDIGKPRLHVDRVFTLKGIGTVVTGTLTGGSLKRGDKLVIQPGGVETRARSLHNHGREVDSLSPGARCAINLADVPVESVRRGDVVTQPELGGPCDTVDVALRISPRAKTKLKHNEIINISLGSGHWRARAALFDTKELRPGEHTIGQLRFEAPIYCFVGDRFIIREASTIAGGVVLDADARRGGLKESRVYSMMPGQPTAAELIRAWLSHDGVVPRAALLVKSRFSAATVEAALSEVGAKVCAAFAADGALWRKTLARAAAAVDQLHRDKPEKPGFPLSELQALLGAGDEVFSEMLGDLCSGGQFVRDETIIRRPAHKPKATGQLNTTAETLLKKLAADPFNTPRRKECDPQALRYLRDAKLVVEFGTDEVLLKESHDEACRRVREFLKQRGQATMSELRELLKTNRRIAVPLLEKMDKDGVTVRAGDVRKLRGT